MQLFAAPSASTALLRWRKSFHPCNWPKLNLHINNLLQLCKNMSPRAPGTSSPWWIQRLWNQAVMEENVFFGTSLCFVCRNIIFSSVLFGSSLPFRAWYYSWNCGGTRWRQDSKRWPLFRTASRSTRRKLGSYPGPLFSSWLCFLTILMMCSSDFSLPEQLSSS